MATGFAGKLLRVDLTHRRVRVETVPDLVLRRYFGGGVLGAYYLLRETPAGLDPYDPAAPILFVTSAMNGTALSGTNRFSVVAKSPLTGGFGESEAGGYWGPALKRAGFDAIIVTGRAEQPTYLLVWDGQCELRDATAYWGKLAGEVDDGIKSELADRQVVVLQTGIAGESRVRYAAIVNNLRHFHGRCGLGAVMAAKNLKAIAVGGTGGVQVAEPGEVWGPLLRFRKQYDPERDSLHQHGTARGIKVLNADGILPTRNFRDGSFPDYEKVAGETMSRTILKRRGTCFSCSVGCKREVEVPARGVKRRFGGPEYESMAALGPLCFVGDLEAVALANQLCNQYVLDSISTGVSIAFAMEAFERGILTRADTDGLDLRFGDPEVVLALIPKIAHREGIGNFLADGVARMAKALGPEAERFAMHVRGQEFPMHEPRGKKGLALAYATSPTGADHVEAPHDPLFEGFSVDNHPMAMFGLLEPVDTFDFGPRKVRAFTYAQKLWSIYNMIGMCAFVGAPFGRFDVNELVTYLRGVTGWNLSLWELCKAAERGSALFRVYNHREGLGMAADTLPARMFEPLEAGAIKGERLEPEQFQTALRQYYEMMGWDPATGLPTPVRLAELDIEWAAQYL